MYFVIKVVNGVERRVFSRHRKEEVAHRAAGKLRLETGIKGIKVVFKGQPARDA